MNNDTLGWIFLIVVFGGGAIIGVFEAVFGNLSKAFQSLGGGHRLRRRVKDLEDELDELAAARREDWQSLRQWCVAVNERLQAMQVQALPPPPEFTLDDWPTREQAQAEEAVEERPRRRGRDQAREGA